MTELRQRQPRATDPAFLAFLRRLPCRACRAPAPSQAAHIRGPDAIFRKRATGMGEKPDDRWALPLCSDCHLDGPGALHKIGEKRFFARAGIDAFAIAAILYDDFLELRGGRATPRAIAARPEKRPTAPGAKYWKKKRELQERPAFKKGSRIPKRKNPWPKGRTFGGQR